MIYAKQFTNKKDFMEWFNEKDFSDPLVVDISGIKNIILQEELKRDYVLIKDFVNTSKKGGLYLKRAVPGIIRLKALKEKASKFNRELVIVYNNEEKYNLLKDTIYE
jgi:hypothetical protein